MRDTYEEPEPLAAPEIRGWYQPTRSAVPPAGESVGGIPVVRFSFGLALADGLASGARVIASSVPAHAEIASLVGEDAPVRPMGPRDTRRFTDSLEASLLVGRIQAGGVQLPSWPDIVADTRELYSRVSPRAIRRSERDPPDLRTLLLPLSAEAELRGAA